jgi:proline dehydrogenase
MLRTSLLYLSEQKRVFAFVRNHWLPRRFASRFVAGETLDAAVAVVRELNARGITASLDLLGESVTSSDESRAATAMVVQMLERISAERLDCNVSVKLTQMGLDLDPGLCAENMRGILDRGRDLGIFVRIDMESSAPWTFLSATCCPSTGIGLASSSSPTCGAVLRTWTA